MEADVRTASIKGRGASFNPKNRFEKLEYELDESEGDRPRTMFLADDSRSIITHNNSPDVGFETSLNPYRGCEHGCAYCFARPTHEYLGFSAGLDFETKIVVKHQAPELLKRELSSPRWKPQVLAMSGVTDCYQPIERKLEITRRCAEILADFRNPVAVITKNHLVTRDIDHYAELARHRAVVVNISITTLDAELAKKLEPRASTPQRRLAAIEELSAAGIPTRVLMAPCVPGLTDHEMPRLFSAAAKAGAFGAGYVPLRLPWAVAPIFQNWLERNYPDRAEKILGRVREMRGGKLNDPRFGSRMRGEGFYAIQMHSMFEISLRKAGFSNDFRDLSTASFRIPTAQLPLF
jgi:DNA repair photolyase